MIILIGIHYANEIVCVFVCLCICSCCNFSEAILFESITDDDIEAVENFVRNDLLDIVLMKIGENTGDTKTPTVDRKVMTDHFGHLYALQPHNFRFQLGDKKFIHLIKQTVLKTIEKKGRKRAMEHFGHKEKQSKKRKLNRVENDSLSAKVEDTKRTTNDELKAKLFANISDKLKTFAIPSHIREMFNESFVTVELNENNNVEGKIVCIVCYAESEQPESVSPNHVYCRNKSGHLTWVISNFIKHFQRAHENIQLRAEKKLCRVKNEQNSKKKLDEITNNNDSNASITTSIEPLNLSYDLNATEMDNLEGKIYGLISKQMIKMWNIATLNGETFEYGVQCNDLGDEHLLDISVDVVNILGNGDCLLSTAVHQKYGKDLSSNEHKTLTENLRADVVKYIKEHYDDFSFDIRGHVHELKDIAANNPDCDLYGFGAMEDIDDACKFFLDECLTRPGFWAGAETLKAIHFLLKVDIIVFCENGPITFYNAKNDDVQNDLMVMAYRVSANQTTYNHYDSVCSMSPDVMYHTAKFVSNRMAQECSSNVDLSKTQE